SPTDPNLALAGTAPAGSGGGSLYRSVDAGATWSKVPGLTGTSVFDIEFTPTGKAYAGAINGIWASEDGGLTWAQLNLGIGPNQQTLDVTVDPSDPDTLWAGIAEALGNQPNNIIRSTDGGASWVNRTPPLPAPSTGAGVAVDPTDPATVIAVFSGGLTGGGSVWVTTDGGGSWTNRSAGLPSNPIDAVDYDGSRLLVGGGQLFGSQHVGLYSSGNLGATWTPLHDASWPILVVDDIAVDPADPDTILVATDANGVHRSTDGGQTWEIGVGGSGSLAGRSLAFAPGSSTTLVLGTSSLGVFRSTDGGDSFVQSATGISELGLNSIAVNPQDSDELAVGFEGQNDGGVLSSTDGGGSWELEPVPPTRYNTVLFAPDGTLYAISGGPSSIAPEGLYRRSAGGSWDSLGPDQGTLFESDLTVLQLSQSDPDLIMLAGSDFGVAGSEATIWRSADRGETWTKTYEQHTSAFVTDLSIVADGTDQRMMAGWFTFSGGPIGAGLHSVDGGQTWQPSTGLPGGFLRDIRLCASPSDPATAYLSIHTSSSTGALFRTGDAGQTWQPIGTVGARINDLGCDPVDDQVLYLSQGGSATAVVRSADQGVTFAPYATGLAGVTIAGELAFAGGGLELLLASKQGSFRTAIRDSVPLPAIGVTPGSIAAEQRPGEQTEHPLTIDNGGDGRLDWRVAEAVGSCGTPGDVPWLSAAPGSGSTPAGGSSGVAVTVDATGLAQGAHSASLCVTSNDPAQPVVAVPVTLTVLGTGGCDQTITGVHDGALTVTEGVTCLAAGSQVRGEVNVGSGAGLIGTAAVIQGPVSAIGAAVLELRFSQVTGPVLVLGSTDSVALFGTQVTGSVSVLSSTTEATISGNTVIGTLSCFGNQPPPTDHGLSNTATGGKLGQCVDL
ncbi:MAG: WD40/YVTN/BNR-like repeat-containing protein, partial [Natronosporangium sp.]